MSVLKAALIVVKRIYLYTVTTAFFWLVKLLVPEFRDIMQTQGRRLEMAMHLFITFANLII